MDLLHSVHPEPKIVAGRKLECTIAQLRVGDRPGCATRLVPTLALTFEGADGDGHAGFTRESGGREPWYPRGTTIRSGRQLSIVSVEDLAAVAGALDLAAIDPGLIGANTVVEGITRFSFLPPGTRLFFDGGAVVVVEGQNAPCRFAGKALADAVPGREDIELGFVAAARRRRGVVAGVERPGTLSGGTKLSVKIPEQWIYG